jgi:hypothetical protein
MKDHNGKLNSDPFEKAKSPDSFLVSLFSSKVITRKYNQQNKLDPSPLVLTLEGSEYQHLVEINPSEQITFLGKY